MITLSRHVWKALPEAMVRGSVPGALLTALCLILFALPGCGDSSPILVGFSGQLTGKVSDMGVGGRNGALLAVEHINKAGGVNGRPLKLVAEDDGNTAEGALAADTALIDAGVVAIIGHMTSSQSMAALPYVNESGIILISPTTSTPLLTGIKDNFTRVMVENPVQSRALATYARTILDIRTIASIMETDNLSYSMTFEETFTSVFEQLGGTFLSSFAYSASGATNWTAIMAELQRLNPDAILLTCPAQDFVTLAQNIRSSGITARLFSGAWAYTDKLLLWGGRDIEGSIFVIDFASDNPSPAFTSFIKAYETRFGSSPNFASAFAYESVLALANGLKKTDGSSEGLLAAMTSGERIQGVTGSFSLDEYGDVTREVFIVTVRDGSFRTVGIR
ncbi:MULTISPECIES: ABC transporter substrate-binding protein [Pseudodesulfovibrio]|nr:MULTISPECIES: ABC transporter substrate-binding protein [Pseudodesulfovibrio]MCG2734464.1 ABC transporter substrate-binding protein [Pseudodesulfovibrio aespoeensis]